VRVFTILGMCEVFLTFCGEIGTRRDCVVQLSVTAVEKGASE
jgi:hypothetical protein